MPRFTLQPALELDELDSYHRDVVASLCLYFSPSNPRYDERFAGRREDDVRQERESRIEESELRSALALLTRLEASFKVDFDFRCKKRKKDALSRHFREVEKKRKERKERARLDEDILEGWKMHHLELSVEIGELRGAFRFRHWLAHGRYWEPKLGRNYDYGSILSIAEETIAKFPFEV
ncbi:MAG: hypothetical protein ACLQGV_08970 [Bryobacteraceae bacterium]